MNGFVRYALYMVPEGECYRKGADWLGWDNGSRDIPSGVPDRQSFADLYDFSNADANEKKFEVKRSLLDEKKGSDVVEMQYLSFK